MAHHLYVGNLPLSASSREVEQLFARFGAVTRAQVIVNRETGESRGFAFVEMADGGPAAARALNGSVFQTRRITVFESRPASAAR